MYDTDVQVDRSALSSYVPPPLTQSLTIFQKASCIGYVRQFEFETASWLAS